MLATADYYSVTSVLVVDITEYVFTVFVYWSLVPCLKIVLSKTMGILILVGIVIGK